MKRFLCVACAVGAIGAFGGAMYISETQAIVQSGLSELKFEAVKQQGGLIGAPGRFKISKQTIAHLESLMKQNKNVTVAADGKISVVDEVTKAE